jgi:hypothetical protein
VEVLLPDHQVVVEGSYDFHTRLQELLEARQRWITQPPSPDREQALKEITAELRGLGRRNSSAT